MTRRALVLHGGGPTAVLNASLAGLALTLRDAALPLHAARFGVRGLLAGDFIALDPFPRETLQTLAAAPGSAIGSSREAVHDYPALATAIALHGFHTVFLNGGNGTMRTARLLHEAASGALQVIGIPKTIDNDIPATDHTPGYGSVARFFAHAVRDAGIDCRSLPSPVMVVETLGRDTGWVTAATALARRAPDDAPHLIYLPEQGVSLQRIAADVHSTVRRFGRCVIAVCEGQKDETGQPFGADVQLDRDGKPRLAANLGHRLAQLIQQSTGLRTRSEKPGLTARSSASLASPRDRADALACGVEAAHAALRGESGIMISLDHSGTTTTVPLRQVTPGLREFPHHWIDSANSWVSPAFLEWLKPLAGDLEDWPNLL